MKNLAADIKTSHKDRTSRVNGIKREAREILGAADDYMQRVSVELKEMARALRDSLAKGEEARKKGFEAMMSEIQARIKEIKAETKAFIAKSEEKRMADFKATMKGVNDAVAEIKRMVGGMLREYKAERKEAAGYWASLGRGKGPSTAEEAPRAEKKEKREKRKEREEE